MAHCANGNLQLAKHIGESLAASGEIEKSTKHFEALANKGDPYPHIRLAAFSLANGAVDTAIQHINQALSIDDLDYRSRLFAGALCLAKSEFSQALRHFRVAAEENNDSSALQLNMGVAFYRIGKKERAIRCAQAAIRLNPLSEHALSFFLDLLIEDESYSEAISRAENYLKVVQRAPFAWERLAKAQYRAKDYRSALRSLLHLASLNDHWTVWNNIALTNWKLKLLDEAIKAFNYSIRLATTDDEKINVLNNYFSVLSSAGRNEQIIPLAEGLIESVGIDKLRSSSVWGSICSNYIWALEEIGQVKKATDLAAALLQDNETEKKLRLRLYIFQTATLSRNVSCDEQALRYARESLELFSTENKLIDESTASALVNNAIYVLLEYGQIDEASRYEDLLKKFAYKHPHSTATLGLYYLKRGALERGRALYQSAVAIAIDHELKEKLRQKMNLELAKYFHTQKLTGNAMWHANKAVAIEGTRWARTEATKLLLQLKSLPA